jgi:hapalindole-type alkaloid chlorinase
VTKRQGHPISILDVDAADLSHHSTALADIYAGSRCGIIVRGAFPEALRQRAAERLSSPAMSDEWGAPNKGMTGGEIRTIGDAATPTFTALRGPTPERYAASAARFEDRTRAIFDDADPVARVAQLLSGLFGDRPAGPPVFDEDHTWSPCNYRALDAGEQIYSHHDNHYGLEVYGHMDPGLDRSTLLSWFITLQAPDAGGELVVYGLWGSDPNPPLLPTRFLDTQALEEGFLKHTCALGEGDLVVFDAGRFVHRVRPVEGDRPRLTLGGFLTVDPARTRLAFWS